MNIKQLASELNCSTAQIINELRIRYPGEPWKPETELPPGFAEEALRQAQKFMGTPVNSVPSEIPGDAPESGGEISKELAKDRDAIAASQLSADAIEYGILEALTIQKVKFCKFYGIHIALQEISSFEDAHNDTWTVYLERKEEILSSKIQELQKALVERAKTRASKTGKLAKTLMEESLISQSKREKQAQELQVLVDAFIGSSTT